MLVLLLVYWVPATLYTIADVLRPAWLYKYKVGRQLSEGGFEETPGAESGLTAFHLHLCPLQHRWPCALQPGGTIFS